MEHLIETLDDNFHHFKIIKNKEQYTITAYIARIDCEDYNEYKASSTGLGEAISLLLSKKKKGEFSWAAKSSVYF